MGAGRQALSVVCRDAGWLALLTPPVIAATCHVVCICVPVPCVSPVQEQRFGEILSVAEAMDVESMKKAVRKSRVVYNRGGAEEQPADTGAC